MSFSVGTLDVSHNTMFALNWGTTGYAPGTDNAEIKGLNFSNASSLSVTESNGSGLAFGGNLSVTGAGNSLSSPIAFDASGKALAFDVTGAGAGSVLLSITGGGTLTTDAATSVSISGNPAVMGLNQSIILASTAAGPFAAATFQDGRRAFTVSLTSGQLLATLTGLQSFMDAQDTNPGLAPWNNINLINGAGYLDWLDTGGSGIEPALMGRLDTLWTDSLALGGRNAAIALEQLYGSYSAYANTGLAVTTGRFRNLWERRNHSFLSDNGVFAGMAPSMSAGGFASGDALASPRYGARDCVPAGRSRIWASGFGSWAKQDADANLAGYKYDSYGAALGYEYSFNNCLQLGLAAAYSRGDLKVDDLRYENKPDILNLALYGVYTHQSGLYAQAGLGYGHAWNDYTTNMLLGGQKKGKYGSDDWSADLELGYVAKLPAAFNLIPSVGLEYDYLRNGGWTESLSGNPGLVANRFDGANDSSLGIPLGLRFNKLFAFGCNGGYVVPEVRAQWVYMADKSRPFVNAGYAGAPGGATMYGVDPGNNYWRLGAGLSGRFNQRVDFRVDYDFDTRSGFRGHNVLATVGVAF